LGARFVGIWHENVEVEHKIVKIGHEIVKVGYEFRKGLEHVSRLGASFVDK
jgi:hypothetical protein